MKIANLQDRLNANAEEFFRFEQEHLFTFSDIEDGSDHLDGMKMCPVVKYDFDFSAYFLFQITDMNADDPQERGQWTLALIHVDRWKNHSWVDGDGDWHNDPNTQPLTVVRQWPDWRYFDNDGYPLVEVAQYVASVRAGK